MELGLIENEAEVSNLRNYLKIRSVQPNVNYDECITFLRGQAAQLGLPVEVVELIPKKPILIMTWTGTRPELPSILLNSHMDVVPVFEKSWAHPPFAADLEDGVIFARGIQDMKSVGIQYIEAIRRLKKDVVSFKRTIHLTFIPDEELGGETGMSTFIKSDQYKKLNIGFALDEGVASPNADFLIFNAERSIWHVNVICAGKSGHGSMLLPDNPGEKLRYIIDKFMDLRKESKKKFDDDPKLTIGDVTSVNLTIVQGGILNNVIPDKFTAKFDLRLALSVDHVAFENMIKQWCTEAGNNVTYEFEQKNPYTPPTKLDDTNPYWVAFKKAADELKISIVPRTFPGGTDSRFIREVGTPAIGFSPMNHTPPELHQHNESLKVETFLNGIRIYEKIIPSLANV